MSSFTCLSCSEDQAADRQTDLPSSTDRLSGDPVSGSPEVVEAATVEPAAVEPAAGKQSTLEPATQDTLSRFFSPLQIAAAAQYQQAVALQHAESSTDSETAVAIFRHAVALEGQLLGPIRKDVGDDIWPALEEFLNADLGLYAIDSSCVAECTIPALALDLTIFQDRARGTSEETDDAFFEILALGYGDRVYLAEGEVVSWPTFFERTWDYGGHSLLGSGVHLSLLGKMERFDHPDFPEELIELRRKLMQDLNSECLGLAATEVVGELSRILELVDLSTDEREALNRQRRKLADPTANGIEVECRKMGCRCNVG